MVKPNKGSQNVQAFKDLQIFFLNLLQKAPAECEEKE